MVRWAWNKTIGLRQKDEDVVVTSSGSPLVPPQAVVLDGHGGKGCAAFCAAYLRRNLPHRNLFGGDEKDAKRVVQTLDDDFLRTCAGDVSGSTLTYVWVDDSKRAARAVWLGDSRAIVVNADGTSTALTTDDAVDGDEKARALARGAVLRVHPSSKKLYLTHPKDDKHTCLNMTRALGDRDLRDAIDKTPHVRDYALREGDTHVVLASDGLWDVCDNAEVADIVRRNPATAAHALATRARDKGSADDISVVVGELRAGTPTPPASPASPKTIRASRGGLVRGDARGRVPVPTIRKKPRW